MEYSHLFLMQTFAMSGKIATPQQQKSWLKEFAEGLQHRAGSGVMGQKNLAKLFRATQPVIESLEERRLMSVAPHPLDPLKVSSNNHYLVHSTDGAPFYYLGDTAWSMLLRLNHTQ